MDKKTPLEIVGMQMDMMQEGLRKAFERNYKKKEMERERDLIDLQEYEAQNHD